MVTIFQPAPSSSATLGETVQLLCRLGQALSFNPHRAILHDGDRYPNPEAFDPTRFLTSDGELNGDVPFPTETFGFSRRICPGRHFAMDVLWLAIANILATFEIEVFADEKGNVEEPSGRYTSGMFR